MAGQVVAALLVMRHGQRSPFPPYATPTTPNTASAGGFNRWSSHAFPLPENWNMTEYAFNHQWLTPNGRNTLFHMGQYARATWGKMGDLCDDVPAVFVADSEPRNVQSGEHFIRGYRPEGCLADRYQLQVADSSLPMLQPVVSDSFATGCQGPTESQASNLFGGHFRALTERYRPEIETVSRLIGCCSDALCSDFGLPSGCSIADLPYNYTGYYWQGLYTGPLSVAAYFSQSFILQAISGLEFAWGGLTLAQAMRLHTLHARVMWFGSNPLTSKAYGSQGLGYILASLDQVIRGRPRDGIMQAPSDKLLMAMFAHDFNLLYLRRLLDASWLTESMDFNTASTGAFISFELVRGNNTVFGLTESSYTVIGSYVAASVQQLRDAAPLVPPYPPPVKSVFLNLSYTDFKSAVLRGIDTSCVTSPLRETLEEMAREARGPIQRLGIGRTGKRALLTVDAIAGISCLAVACLTVGCFIGIFASHGYHSIISSREDSARRRKGYSYVRVDDSSDEGSGSDS